MKITIGILLFTLQKLKKIISATYFKNSRYRKKQFVKCIQHGMNYKAEKTRLTIIIMLE